MEQNVGSIPAQSQGKQPGLEHEMHPKPQVIRDNYKGSGKLEGKIALISGGDSGIGRSVAVHYAREGADVAIIYLDEDKDAEETKGMIEKEGRKCLLLKGDIGGEAFCKEAINETVEKLGSLDILVNNAAEQHPKGQFEEVSAEQFRKTYETNIFSFFYCAHAAIEHMKEGSSIINTSSVTAYRGSGHLIDYSSTKGAIVSFTRSLGKSLAERGIRVNAVAPGPIWTPLIPSTFDEKQVAEFGKDTPMKRPGQPSEVGPAYVFLASEDASYITGQVIHINGGEVVGG